MVRTAAPRLVEQVHDSLRLEIVQGRLVPGQRILLADVAAAHGVSLTVVREAITRLTAEHLVETTPRSGFQVRPISVEHLRELTWLRCEVEEIALRDAIARGGTEWEARVVATHHVLGATARLGPDGVIANDWLVAHADFHGALVSACRSDLLLGFRQQLFDASELYRSVARGPADGERDVKREHSAIQAATLERDADRAVALLCAHFRATADLAERFAAQADTGAAGSWSRRR